MAISNATLKPFFPEQERFLRVINGEESPINEVVRDWLRLLKECTEFDHN